MDEKGSRSTLQIHCPQPCGRIHSSEAPFCTQCPSPGDSWAAVRFRLLFLCSFCFGLGQCPLKLISVPTADVTVREFQSQDSAVTSYTHSSPHTLPATFRIRTQEQRLLYSLNRAGANPQGGR